MDCASARSLQTQEYIAQYPRDIAVLGVLTAKCLGLEAPKRERLGGGRHDAAAEA